MRSFLVVCLLAGVVCAGSAGAAPVGWSAPVLVDHQPPFASFGGLEGISCTSASLCIAIDIEQNVVASANPTGGAGAWSWSNVGGSNYVDLASYGLAVSCQSPPLCVAVAGQTILTSTNPTGGPSAWTATKVASQVLMGVSCPSVSLCVAVDNYGSILTSTNPTGGASAWSITSVPGESALNAVSCSSTSLCVAVGGGNVVASSAPTAGAGAWTVANVDGTNNLDGVSCVSILCIAVDGSGNVATSTNPSGGAAAWKVGSADGSGLPLTSVACPTNSLCVAVGSGRILTSTDPNGGNTTWRAAPFAGDYFAGVSCASNSLCVAVDGSDVLTSVAPTGGSAAWTSTPRVDGWNALSGIACPSSTSCVMTDNGGNVLTPIGGATSWTVTNIDSAGLSSPSCPATSFCVAVDGAGNVARSNDPAGGAAAWMLANIDGTTPLVGVSCPSMSFCVAADNAGNVLISTNPAGTAPVWTSTHVWDGSLSAISCASSALCVAVAGSYVIASGNPTGGAAAWSSASVSASNLAGVACPSESLCVAGGRGVVTSTNPTGGSGAWTSANPDPLYFLFGVACASATSCFAWDNHGNLASSSNPAGGTGAWTLANIDGNTLSGIACPSSSACIASDAVGNVVRATGTLPANNSPPVVSGSPAVGQLLSCSTGSWSGTTPISYGYEWLRDGSAIGSATSSTYTVVDADAGHALSCRVTATNSAGSSSATSAAVEIPAVAPSNTSLPVVSGSPAVGQTLFCSQGSWSGTQPISYGYEWLRDGTPIGSASGSSYTVAGADAGHALSCRVTATNAGGNASATSATVQIPATAPANTAPPVISGVPAVGQTLTCSQGSWSGTQPLTYAFQWLRDGKAINGASGPTHLVAQADAGNALTCRVTATNAAGAASATSSPVQIPKKR